MSRRVGSLERRGALLQILQGNENAYVSFEQILNGLKGMDENYRVSEVTLYNDLRLLEGEGYAVDVSKKQARLRPIPREWDKRLTVEPGKKGAIGSLIKELCTISSIQDFAEHWLIQRTMNRGHFSDGLPLRLKSLLRSFSTKRQRFLSMDAGTTTLACAREFAKISLPNPSVSAITLLTNSPAISNELLHTSDLMEILFMPGYLRKTRFSLIGFPEWLETVGLETDLAVIGTTGWSLNGWAADSVYEAKIKIALLEHARVRIIVTDSSKLDRATFGSRFVTFAENASPLVDMVMTDESVRGNHEFLQIMNESHTAVIVAPNH